MGDINELKTERNKTMANLPGSIKNLNTLLGEQLLEGGGSGGGGSSDFSTAEVTVVGLMSNALPVVEEDGIIHLGYLNSETATIVIGLSGLVSKIEGVSSVSGNIENKGKIGYLITGDCTITISKYPESSQGDSIQLN